MPIVFIRTLILRERQVGRFPVKNCGVRPAQVFVAQDHDHMIGKPDALHETSNEIARAHGGRGAEDMPTMLRERDETGNMRNRTLAPWNRP
jgi:hypothetical protein